MQADVGSDEVKAAEGIEGAADDQAGDAVQRGEVPGDLRLVDGEMRSDGAVEALLCEDVVLLGLFGDCGCCCESGIAG